MGGDREGESHVHPARVPLHRRIDEALDPGEVDDFVELPPDFPSLHPQDRAIEEDVLASAELRMKTGSDLHQAAHTAAALSLAAGRRPGPGQDLEQRRLAGTVP